ncbi:MULTISPECIES: DUF3332 domain-containing protein [unclassified Carboxylicivirga]|uniref:DUF3332 domain-containing protein n=1 Tax=Carboxylicivirga TaxID=1628153 RepID=UPI003D356EC4
MKKLKLFSLAGLLLLFSIGQSGCYGSFRLTNNLYDWNSTVGSKFSNALVFFAFVVIPVYEVAVLVDGVVLNTIEFWSGGNPVSMHEGDMEQKIVKKDGNEYLITATVNKFHIEQLNGDQKGSVVELIFNPDDQSWSLKDGNKELQKLVEQNGDIVNIYKPNGDFIQVESTNHDVAAIREQLRVESPVFAMD